MAWRTSQSPPEPVLQDFRDRLFGCDASHVIVRASQVLAYMFSASTTLLHLLTVVSFAFVSVAVPISNV